MACNRRCPCIFGSQRNKDIVTYDGGDVNGIHHTGGIFQRGGQLKLFNQAKFSLQNIERVCIMCARDYTKSL